MSKSDDKTVTGIKSQNVLLDIAYIKCGRVGYEELLRLRFVLYLSDLTTVLNQSKTLNYF